MRPAPPRDSLHVCSALPRRAALAFLVAAPSLCSLLLQRTSANAASLEALFADAFAAGAAGAAADADAAWTAAVELAPTNAAAWSNRGTARLQAGAWELAASDLKQAAKLEPSDALTLNNLGNAQAALGQWDAALASFAKCAALAGAASPLGAISRMNAALVTFEAGDGVEALRAAHSLLRRDPEFWDARAAAAAFLWAAGREADAEAEWAALCKSGRGFGGPRSAEAQPGEDASSAAFAARLLTQQFAQQAAVVTDLYKKGGGVGGGGGGTRAGDGDDTPCRLYADPARVAGRWPPRATAALDAFRKVARAGRARGYDGVVREYTF